VQANLTRRYTARAIDFIQRNQSRGFFLYLAHAMPHKPLAASETFYKKTGDGLYGDVMAELDWSVGQVLQCLQQLGLEENTLVIFTSDNGPYFGGSTGGLRGMKASSYEGGYRVPCIARWPGKIPAGHVNHAPGVMMDLFVTTLKAAGIAAPTDRVIDGRDLFPQFTSDATSQHAGIVGQLGARLATIRDARWKLHVVPPQDPRIKVAKPGERWIDPRGPDGVTLLAPYEQYQPQHHPGVTTGDAPAPMQLFDLLSDPAEQHDVAPPNRRPWPGYAPSTTNLSRQPRPEQAHEPNRFIRSAPSTPKVKTLHPTHFRRRTHRAGHRLRGTQGTAPGIRPPAR
jgi:arylsulfatase A-like enzyme